jgi:hypothetical protein
VQRSLILTFIVVLCVSAVAQKTADLGPLDETEKAFSRMAAAQGAKAAFLSFLSEDSVVFRPDRVNGREFWKSQPDNSSFLLVRHATFSDLAASGMLGYTTGDWGTHPHGKPDSASRFGQYATIWEKRLDGKFHATVDISIEHEQFARGDLKKIEFKPKKSRDINKRGWSVADASMNFMRSGMTHIGMSGAYDRFAAPDIRVLLPDLPPITGRKNAITAMRDYRWVEFPKKVALLQAADMAYNWNPCQFINSAEGIISGNCLQVWKLRDKKWWIVLSVFAPLMNEKPPELKVRDKPKAGN